MTNEHLLDASGQPAIPHTPVMGVLDREGRLAPLIRDEALEPDRVAGLLEHLVLS